MTKEEFFEWRDIFRSSLFWQQLCNPVDTVNTKFGTKRKAEEPSLTGKQMFERDTSLITSDVTKISVLDNGDGNLIFCWRLFDMSVWVLEVEMEVNLSLFACTEDLQELELAPWYDRLHYFFMFDTNKFKSDHN
jgi:hypothetical protein